MIKNSKKRVVEILLEEKNLTVNEIYLKLKKEYSYHAVYKAVRQLTDKNIVIKDKNRYTFSGKWIDTKVDFLGKLEKYKSNIYEGKVLKFQNIVDYYRFLRDLEKKELKIFDNKENREIIWVVYHCYNYLFQPSKELFYVKKLAKHNIKLKILCYCNSKIDNWTKDGYEKFGAQMKTGAEVGSINGLCIYDNLVVEVFYGKEFLDIVEKTFARADINDVNLGIMFEKLFSAEYQINVALHTDEGIINSLKERALSFL